MASVYNARQKKGYGPSSSGWTNQCWGQKKVSHPNNTSRFTLRTAFIFFSVKSGFPGAVVLELKRWQLWLWMERSRVQISFDGWAFIFFVSFSRAALTGLLRMGNTSDFSGCADCGKASFIQCQWWSSTSTLRTPKKAQIWVQVFVLSNLEDSLSDPYLNRDQAYLCIRTSSSWSWGAGTRREWTPTAPGSSATLPASSWTVSCFTSRDSRDTSCRSSRCCSSGPNREIQFLRFRDFGRIPTTPRCWKKSGVGSWLVK